MRMCCKPRWPDVIGRKARAGRAGIRALRRGVVYHRGLPGSDQTHWHMCSGSMSLSGCALGAVEHNKRSFRRTFPMANSPVTILNVIEDVRAGP